MFTVSSAKARGTHRTQTNDIIQLRKVETRVHPPKRIKFPFLFLFVSRHRKYVSMRQSYDSRKEIYRCKVCITRVCTVNAINQTVSARSISFCNGATVSRLSTKIITASNERYD